MNRSLKLSMLVALALGSSQVMALDLGQIQVKSALGQPLLAEIPLHPANPAELQNLTVQLASSEDFERAGIAGGRTTIPLHFSVANSSNGQRVIRITSSAAVDDPYLDLLLEVNSHAGKSVREFAILLDPPGTAPAPAAVAAAPVAAKPAAHAASVAPAPTAAAQPVQDSTSPAKTTPTASADGKYGPVERGQTLSSIARNAAAPGVDVHQMMLAFKQANPEAFYRDNINALKTGVVLRVPTASEAQTMALAAAVAEVSRQNSDWRAGNTVKPTTVGDTATRASASSSPSNTASDTSDHLALVPAKEGTGTGSQGTGGKASKSHQDLLRTQESLASLQQQSDDLKTRLKDLADINSKNEHLLSLKDNQIAELQSKLAAASKNAALPATVPPVTVASAATTSSTVPTEAVVAPATSGTAIAADAAPATASTASVTTPAAATSAAIANVPAAAASVVKPATVAPAIKAAMAPAATPMVEQPWYMQTWAWAAGAGAVVVLLLLAMLGRRRKTPPATSLPKLAPSLADRFSAPPAAGVGAEDIDQDELLDQLAEHPDDIGLHLELVTLYYSRRDVEHFEAAAEAMQAHVTDPQQDEWQDVMHMGEDLAPGHPLFDHHAPLPAHEESEALHTFDIDDYSAEQDTTVATSSMPPLPPQEGKQIGGYSFNFDLGSSAADEPAPGSESHANPPMTEPLMDDADDMDDVPPVSSSESVSSWRYDESEGESLAGSHSQDLGEFNDDPVDTKLDLARAYLDMGDADGARAMLGEVLKEGSQTQQDVAKGLLATLH